MNLCRPVLWRRVFFVKGCWNCVGSIAFFFGEDTLRQWLGAGATDPVYRAQFLALAFVFGLGYLWVSRDLAKNHTVVWMGVLGQFSVFITLSYAVLSQSLVPAFIWPGVVDLIFALLFLVFLWTHPRCVWQTVLAPSVTAATPTDPALLLASGMVPGEAPKGSDISPGLFAANFFSIIALGTALSAWIYYFTDWFGPFLTLLSLGGLLSWLTLVMRILPEGRLATFRDWGTWLFEGQHTWTVALFLLVMGLATWNFVGTIELENFQPGADTPVWIYTGKKEESTPETLVVKGSLRTLKLTCWWQPPKYWIHMPGLPEKEVTVLPAWKKESYQVPYSFLRPVVLIDYDSFLVGSAIANDKKKKPNLYHLHIEVDGKALPPHTFDGHPVWLGCRDLALPPEVRKRWDDKKYLVEAEHASRYLDPKPHSHAIVLTDRQMVKAWIERTDKKTIAFQPRSIKTHQPRTVAEVVQSVTLDNEP